MVYKKFLSLPTILFVFVLLGVGCGRVDNGIQVGSTTEEGGPTISVGMREEEGCENLGIYYDPTLGKTVKNRTITASFPADIPRPSLEWGEWRVGTARCGNYRQGGREAYQYVVVWYGKADPKMQRPGVILNAYKDIIKEMDWEITNEGSRISFSAQKDGGRRTLYVATGGFISEEDKNEVFSEANINLHVDHKQWQ